MASVRMIKKDIDYLVSEVLSDCYMTIYFHPEKKQDIVKVMEDATELRNALIAKVNSPVEKNNPSLVRKHYAQVRRDVLQGIDGLFVKLSGLCK